MFFKQVLMLGGIYFLLSFVFDYLLPILVNILFVGLCLVVTLLFIKKSFAVLETFFKNYPKTTNYILAWGMTQYFGFIFLGIPAMVDGYRAAQAEYFQLEHTSPYSQYAWGASLAYICVFFASCIWATYQSFIKKSHYNRKSL